MDEKTKREMAAQLKASVLRMRDDAEKHGLDQTAAGRKTIKKVEKLIRDYGLDDKRN